MTTPSTAKPKLRSLVNHRTDFTPTVSTVLGSEPLQMEMSFLTITASIVALLGLYVLSSIYKLLDLLLSPYIDSQLSFSPNELSTTDVTAIILSLVVRLPAHLLRGAPEFRDSLGAPPYTYIKLPPITLSMPIRINQHDVELYKAATDLPSSTRIQDHAGHLLLFLSAVTEPAMSLLLAKRSFHLNPLGAVNVRNRIELLRPDIVTETALSQLSGSLTATVLERARPVKKGLEIDLQVQLLMNQAGKPTTVFQQTFTMLKFMKLDPSMIPARDQPIENDYTAQGESFEMDAEDPRKWATMCKDYNPIHTSAIVARLLGFKGKLAHGNHIIAKGIECLRQASLIDQSAWDKVSPPTWLEVRFVRPVILPATLQAHRNHSTRSSRMAFNQSELAATAEIGFL